MKQKGLAPILIVLLIALAVGGYLLYQKQTKPVSISQSSPTPIASDETANWKIFNSNLSFSFKYPQNFWITSSETRKKDQLEHGDAPSVPQGTVGFIRVITSIVDSADSVKYPIL